VVFEADYDEIELQVTKIMSQQFFQFGPLPVKISGYASGLGLII